MIVTIIELVIWPVCTFIFLSIIFLILKKEIVYILSKRPLRIGWGDKKIHIGELSENLDKELEPIKADIKIANKRIDFLESVFLKRNDYGPVAIFSEKEVGGGIDSLLKAREHFFGNPENILNMTSGYTEINSVAAASGANPNDLLENLKRFDDYEITKNKENDIIIKVKQIKGRY